MYAKSFHAKLRVHTKPSVGNSVILRFDYLHIHKILNLVTNKKLFDDIQT